MARAALNSMPPLTAYYGSVPFPSAGIPPFRPPLYDDGCYNSLIHHGGHNGLIRWGIVMHGFIDEHTRFVPGIRAHDNNREEVVLGFFEELIEAHGLPRRVRGSCSPENVLVAEYMEDIRGSGRGSYLWTSANHNIRNRIGRLWANFTMNLGAKWRDFFDELEYSLGLNPEIPGHIWLLHYQPRNYALDRCMELPQPINPRRRK